MFKKTLLSLSMASALVLTGCGSSTDNENGGSINILEEDIGSFPEFNFATGDFPVPNDILFALESAGDGTFVDAAPTATPPEVALGFLDGASTIAPIELKFNGSIDESSIDSRLLVPVPELGGLVLPNPNQNVFLLELAFPGGDALVQASIPVLDDDDNPVLDDDGEPVFEGVEAPTFAIAEELLTYVGILDALAEANAALADDDPSNDAAATATLTALGPAVTPALAAVEEAAIDFRVDVVTQTETDGSASTVLRINPLEPLAPQASHVVFLTDGILGGDGEPTTQDPAFASLAFDDDTILTADLLPLVPGIQAFVGAAEGYLSIATNPTISSIAEVSGEEPELLTSQNITVAFNRTTGGTDGVLKAMAAPETFVVDSLITAVRQAAIVDVVTGALSLNVAQPTPSTVIPSELEAFISSSVPLIADPAGAVATINAALIDTLTGDDTALTFIEPIASGDVTTFAPLASDPAAAFIVQKAVADIAEGVVDGDDPSTPASDGNFAQVALGVVIQLGADDGAPTPAGEGLGVNLPSPVSTIPPGTMTSDLFLDLNGSTNAGFGVRTEALAIASEAFTPEQLSAIQPGLIMQGAIELPSFLPIPTDEDPSPLVTGTWTADEAIGEAAGPLLLGDDFEAGDLPPSDKVTFRFPFAAEQGTITVPMLVSVPDTNDDGEIDIPASGLPVVVYQHGIFGDRTNSLAAANGLGSACIGANTANTPGAGLRCFATVAIDLPLHGVAPTIASGDPNPFASFSVDNTADPMAFGNLVATSGTIVSNVAERTFGLNPLALGGPPTEEIVFDDPATPEDESFGFSGAFFQNLLNFPATRDNLRQATMDLLTLVASLGDIDLDDDGTPDLDTSEVYFIGHSLGGIVGTVFSTVNNDPDVEAFSAARSGALDILSTVNNNGGLQPQLLGTVLANTSGSTPRILENSPSLGGPILSALAGFGAPQGSASFEAFINIFQATVDSADPVNFAPILGSYDDTGILLTEIFGDGTDPATRDLTIAPNSDAVDNEPNGPSGTGALTDAGVAATFFITLDEDGNEVINPTQGYLGPTGSAFDSTLVGTETLIRLIGASANTGATPAGTVGIAGGDSLISATRFNAGTHTTIITIDDLAVFSEMATQFATFFSTGGTEITFGLTSSDVVSDAEPDVGNIVRLSE